MCLPVDDYLNIELTRPCYPNSICLRAMQRALQRAHKYYVLQPWYGTNPDREGKFLKILPVLHDHRYGCCCCVVA